MALVHSPKIVTDKLILCVDSANTKSYPGSGTTWTDMGSSGFTGALTNMTASNHTSGASGYFTFDGSNESVFFTGGASISIPPITISAWMKRDGAQAEWTSPISGRDGSSAAFCFSVYSGDELRYTWENQSTSWNYNPSITIPNNEWVMCAVSVTSSAATLYMFELDGTVSKGTNTTTHNSGTYPPGDLAIGEDPVSSNNRFFKGDISACLVYSKALSQTELQQNFNALKRRYGL